MYLFYFTRNYVFVGISKQDLDKTSRCVAGYFRMLNTYESCSAVHEQPDLALSLLRPQMFLTVNLVTGSKARVTNHQRVESFGSELQWLPRTLF